jgi:putative ABC transport system permease protein
MALTLSGVSKKERKKKAKAVLDKVGLSEHIRKKPNQLSGGQMQRVAIARALVNNPDIILADEPTGNLNFAIGEQVIKSLVSIAKNKTLITVTHDDRLAPYFDYIIDMNEMTGGIKDIVAHKEVE